MKCQRYTELLHLNRDGERSARKERQLQRHLRACDACKAERAAIERTAEFFERLSSSRPVVPNPTALESAILSSVRSADRTRRGTIILGRIFHFIERPAFQLASAAIITAAIALFMIQYAGIMHRVDRLEARFANEPESQPRLETVYSIDARDAREAARDVQIELPPMHDALMTTDKRIVVSQSRIDEWIDLVRLAVAPPESWNPQSFRRVVDRLVKSNTIIQHTFSHGV